METTLGKFGEAFNSRASELLAQTIVSEIIRHPKYVLKYFGTIDNTRAQFMIAFDYENNAFFWVIHREGVITQSISESDSITFVSDEDIRRMFA